MKTNRSATARRVGLMTLPLHGNYGGLMQIIALYAAVYGFGHTPILINKVENFSGLKRFLSAVLETLPGQNLRQIRGRALARNFHRPFLERVMPEQSNPVRSGADIEAELDRLLIDTVIVGSDQVWRLDYQADGGALNFFLDFGDEDLRRLSYAASFGHSSWPTPKLVEPVGRLIRRFDAVSVRETSGVEICRESFGRDDALHVLDPTLLHEAAFYEALLEPPAKPGGVLTYVLDHAEAAVRIARAHGDEITTMTPNAGEILSVPQWLGRIAAADFVVTDSYHGTIFSIIFGKPFVTLVNRARGQDRFTSLFPALGLGERMVSDPAGFRPEDMPPMPDYADIHARLTGMRAQSLDFLRQALAAPDKN
jgi:hypothetical protein